jgi:two-component system nitrate/nitrite sensor histidine kinase NarX
MNTHRRTVASKLFAIGLTLLVLALVSIALTLWVSWQLEGGAAAVNEAGRMRMLTYRMALQQQQAGATAPQPIAAVEVLDTSLERLRSGEPSRPLFVPWNDNTRHSFAAVQLRWQELKPRWAGAPAGRPSTAELDAFVDLIDAFVSAIEQSLSRWTDVLRAFQFTMVALAIGSAVTLLYTAHLVVFEPLQRLQHGLQRVSDGDFSAHIELDSGDEFSQLAEGFNRMAGHLQALYRGLESKVAEKTEHLEVKRQRLAALYEVSAFIAGAETLGSLAQGFANLVRNIAQADAVAVRWADEANERYLMLAAEGLPAVLAQGEQCLAAGDCHCGQPAADARLRVIPLRLEAAGRDGTCAKLGYRTLLSVPVSVHHRVLGEVDLFFRNEVLIGDEERSLYETLASHLASGIESLRAAALEKEGAVAHERTLLAQELHDSIAQSLAFLKMQVALLRDATNRGDAAGMERTLNELDAGVRESYADVRELLLHFRTRASEEDIGAALRTTLSKFEHQSGVRAQLSTEGHGVALPADVQIQVLHIVQEALSNVRKHADAGLVRLHVSQTPYWRFEITDDGRGFEPADASGEMQVGLRIMRERAARIGASVDLRSAPGAGTTVTLSLSPETANGHDSVTAERNSTAPAAALST